MNDFLNDPENRQEGHQTSMVGDIKLSFALHCPIESKEKA
jgi:hypothetical protein